MEARSDAQVIDASWVDPRVFAAVFDRHYDAVHRYLARRVGSDLADDLAAETFTTAFDARRRYDTAYPNARPWLFGIATNLLRHHRRGEARRLRAYASLDRPADPDGGSGGIDARVDAGRAGPAIADALTHLSRVIGTSCSSSPGPTSGTRRSPWRCTSRSGRCDRGSIALGAKSVNSSATPGKT